MGLHQNDNVWICVAAAQALDAGLDEGGAQGADSDEEEKRANRARAANKDPRSMAESRNQSPAADVGLSAPTMHLLQMCKHDHTGLHSRNCNILTAFEIWQAVHKSCLYKLQEQQRDASA